MNIEYETKVTDIDVIQIIKKLKTLKAIEKPEILCRRFVFDMHSENIEWIRIRQIGNISTMTYKYKVRGNTDIGKTIEIEVEVSDFDKTVEILSKLNQFKETFYQENKKHTFHLHDIEFSIESWPLIKPYLEIEAPDKEQVAYGLNLLDLTGKDVGDKDIKVIYHEANIDIHSFSELKF